MFGGLLVISLAILLLMICVSPLRASIDTGIITEAAIKIVAGQRPYIDFFEFDLPTIYYLHILPVYFSQWLSLNVMTMFNLEVYGLITLTCAAIVMLMRRIAGRFDGIGVYLLAIVVVLQAMIAFGARIYVYGQREHFILLAYLPWFLLRWWRWNAGSEDQQGENISPYIAFAIGFAACVGASIKPFYVPMFLIADLYWLITKRRRRPLVQPEVAGALGFALIYGLYFFIINPEPVQHYLHDLAPIIASGYLAWGGTTISELLRTPSVFVVFGLSALPWVLPNRSTSKLWPMARPLSLVIVAALVAFILQQKGWFYQRMPVDGLVFFLAVLGAHRLLNQRRAFAQARFTRRLYRTAILALWLTVVIVSTGAILSWLEAEGDAGFKRLLDTYTQAGDSVLYLDTCCSVYPTVEQHSRFYASRYLLGAFPIVFGYYHQDVSTIYARDHQVPPLVQAYLDSIPQDIELANPTMIYVGKGQCMYCAPEVDLLAYFEARGVIDSIDQSGYIIAEDTPFYRVYVLPTERG